MKSSPSESLIAGYMKTCVKRANCSQEPKAYQRNGFHFVGNFVTIGLRCTCAVVPSSWHLKTLFFFPFWMLSAKEWDDMGTRIMRRSNRNFNIPPPLRANPGHLTIFCARGVGNFICKAFLGMGIWPLPGCGGENSTKGVSFFFFFFFGHWSRQRV